MTVCSRSLMPLYTRSLLLSLLLLYSNSLRIELVTQPANTADYPQNTNYIVIRRGDGCRIRVVDGRFIHPTVILRADHNGQTITATPVEGANYVVDIRIPSSASIGTYSFHVQDIAIDVTLFVIFNPYGSDTVSMTKSDLAEYIENPNGVIWKGSRDNMERMRWFYAQFSRAAVETAMKLLTFFSGDRTRPEDVGRFLSFAVQYQPRHIHGVLIGKWDETDNYAGGKPPTWWEGSEAIFAQYLATRRPVKYAQCWVFAGVLNSLLRTVGIPSRQVTTFDSAHEEQQNGVYRQRIEYYLDERTRRIVGQRGSIWTFHSWNEAWMSPRRGAASGWQVLDATPQELSDGAYQLGPAAVGSVRAGDVNAPYDTAFVLSEVASVVYWYTMSCDFPQSTLDSSQCASPKLASVDTTRVGSLIVTKQLGLFAIDFDIITGTYKPPPSRRLAGEGTNISATAHILGQPQEGEPIEVALFFIGPFAQPQNVSVVVACYEESSTGGVGALLSSLSLPVYFNQSNSFMAFRLITLNVTRTDSSQDAANISLWLNSTLNYPRIQNKTNRHWENNNISGLNQTLNKQRTTSLSPFIPIPSSMNHSLFTNTSSSSLFGFRSLLLAVIADDNSIVMVERVAIKPPLNITLWVDDELVAISSSLSSLSAPTPHISLSKFSSAASREIRLSVRVRNTASVPLQQPILYISLYPLTPEIARNQTNNPTISTTITPAALLASQTALSLDSTPQCSAVHRTPPSAFLPLHSICVDHILNLSYPPTTHNFEMISDDFSILNRDTLNNSGLAFPRILHTILIKFCAQGLSCMTLFYDL